MSEKPITFRWKYVVLPLVVLFISLALTTFFYHLLPDKLIYHFEEGSPGRWADREVFLAFVLVPQFLLALAAVAIIWIAVLVSVRFRQRESLTVKKTLMLMGNMVALPQVILGFAMLDIFSYNAYQTHIMPLWQFTLIVMLLGGVVLGASFFSIIRRVWQVSPKVSKEQK